MQHQLTDMHCRINLGRLKVEGIQKSLLGESLRAVRGSPKQFKEKITI